MVISPLLLLIATLVHGQKDINVFLESPESTLSPLRSSASFSCSVLSAEARELLWEVDGGQTSSESYAEDLRQRGLQWSSSEENQKARLQLTVLTSEANNETRIVCVAFTVRFGIVKTPPAFLYVYDHPSSPAILSLDPITPGQLSLTWSQPYSPPTVLLSYIVTITQMDPNGGSFGQPLSVVVENSTTYIFTPAVQSCNEYSFTVQAENLAGTSEYSEAVSETLPVAPNVTLLSSSLTHTLAVDDNGIITCNITFVPAETCLNYPVIRYMVHILNTLTNITTFHALIPTLSPNGLLLQLDSNDGLERDSSYVYYVTAKNGGGVTESERRQLITTDVSSVVVTLDCPTLNISCHLLPGSLARGCFVSLIPISQKPGETDQGSVVNKTVARTNSSLEARAVLVLTPHSCCHQLQVYDWEDDGSTGLISIPLTTESMLCDIPEVVTGDNTTGSNRAPSWLYLAPIIASVVGGVVLIAAMLLLVGLGVYCHHKTRTVKPAKESNQEPRPPSQEPQFHDPPTTLPPPPPLYDQPDSLISSINIDDNGDQVRYSILTRDSYSSHAPLTADITHQPLYSKLNHYDAVNPLRNNSVTTLPTLPGNTHIYCDPHSTTSNREHEFINSIPSAGTSV